MSNLVSIRNLSKTYQRGPEKVEVLHGIDLDIPTGDFVALMGPSGSGKTTLLNLIGGLDSPTGGRSRSPASASTRSAVDSWRTGAATHVGFVFQFYNLMPTLTAQKNVELPLLLTKLGAAQRKRNAEIGTGQLVGLTDRAAHPRTNSPAASSSAWRSPAHIVSDPTLMICDEPTGDLDRQSAEEILGLLQSSTASTARPS
ncbi:MAG: ATP-binding cassette domain-containing protein [Chiayiivirga sp.]|jgi:putative ABC transport system ATP-binding protein|nr:ATP-binding cassette domain-containing protein [Chiayiivirga sp.]